MVRALRAHLLGGRWGGRGWVPNVLLTILAIAGCVSRAPAEGRACPCVPGWSCCKIVDVCVRDGETCPGGSAEASFDRRCKASGVIGCFGFDSPSDFVGGVWPGSGLYPSGDGTVRAKMDESTVASGRGSLRFEIPGKTVATAGGQWRRLFGQTFGPGQTFYVQFRQRFSTELLALPWPWMQVLFHGTTGSCAKIELTCKRSAAALVPILATDCSRRVLQSDTNPPLVQNGVFTCPVENLSSGSCFFYPADRWVTFTYEVSVGAWDAPNSVVQGWVALEGQPRRGLFEFGSVRLGVDMGNDGFGGLSLLPFMDGKDPGVEHATARTWYDELVISTEPIDDP